MNRDPRAGERGVALVMAIVILLVISILGAMVMQTVTTERRITGHDLRASRSLSLAEAGVAEAVSRIRSGDAALDPDVPHGVAVLYNTTSGGLPSLGADSVALASLQPEDARLDYTTSGRSPDALVVAYKLSASGRIVRHDEALTVPTDTVSGLPIYTITSTGRVLGDRATIVAEVVPKPGHPQFHAALTTRVGVTTSGAVALCGHAHAAHTPWGRGDAGRTGVDPCTSHETGRGDVPGLALGGSFTDNGGSQVAGLPQTMLTGQLTYDAMPWEVLGIEEAELREAWGSPVSTLSGLAGRAALLDDDTQFGNASGAFTLGNLAAEGVLVVDGDLTLTGPTRIRGLLYVTGNLSLSTDVRILGAVVALGRAGSAVQLGSGVTILASRDAVNAAWARCTGDFLTLSWRVVR